MNLTRIVILCVAAVAAGAAALLVRGMLGGGTPEVQASLPPVTTADVLVAAKDIGPGRALDVDSVRWEVWPKGSVSEAFIVREAQPDIEKAVAGVIVRTPLVTGQPITDAFIVRAGSAGFLAAIIAPGMRAVSMPVSPETGAGGFILPNDRVDVILTLDVSGGSLVKNFIADTILRDVRVLAIDQTAEQPEDKQTAVAKTATLELTPAQAELIEQAQKQGTLSLALRPLGDSSDDSLVNAAAAFRNRPRGDSVSVIRYGVARNADTGEERVPQ